MFHDHEPFISAVYIIYVLLHKKVTIPLREIIDDLLPLRHLNSKISESQTQLLRRKRLLFRTYTFWYTYCICRSSHRKHTQSEYKEGPLHYSKVAHTQPSDHHGLHLHVCHINSICQIAFGMV